MSTSGDEGRLARKVAVGNSHEEEYEHEHEEYYAGRLLVMDRSGDAKDVRRTNISQGSSMESTNVPLNHMFQRQKKRAIADLGGLSLDKSGRWGVGERKGICLRNQTACE